MPRSHHRILIYWTWAIIVKSALRDQDATDWLLNWLGMVNIIRQSVDRGTSDQSGGYLSVEPRSVVGYPLFVN